jgi:hypothetical protein
MIDQIIPHITERIRTEIPRKQLITAQHDALDMFVFLRRHYPAFVTEQARNMARMPRCVSHADRTAPVYVDKKKPLCAECFVALVDARKERSNPVRSVRTLIFLGGTAANNPWREAFIADLAARGVDPAILFNPVVSDWNEEAQAREEVAKAKATHHVYYIADPMQGGNPLSAYSMVEAAMALYDQPDTTVVIFDTAGMEGHPLKAMNQAARILVQRHPNANIFTSVEAAKNWLADQLLSS